MNSLFRIKINKEITSAEIKELKKNLLDCGILPAKNLTDGDRRFLREINEKNIVVGK